jgi:hypothetical protein
MNATACTNLSLALPMSGCLVTKETISSVSIDRFAVRHKNLENLLQHVLGTVTATGT